MCKAIYNVVIFTLQCRSDFFRNMIDGKTWPALDYVKCSTSNLTAVVRKDFELRKAFMDVILYYINIISGKQ